MNKELSQARANAVVDALLARRVLTSNLTAVGYGEENPIADNETEEGREANRRIEFRLIEEVEATPEEATAEALATDETDTPAGDAQDVAAEDQSDTAPGPDAVTGDEAAASDPNAEPATETQDQPAQDQETPVNTTVPTVVPLPAPASVRHEHETPAAPDPTTDQTPAPATENDG